MANINMAFSPIPVRVSGTFGDNSTMRRFIVNANGYEFSVDASDGSITLDVSSTIRGQLMENFDIATSTTDPSASISLSAKSEYMTPAGVFVTGDASVNPSSVTAYLGRWTELERYKGSFAAVGDTAPTKGYIPSGLSANPVGDAASYSSSANEPDYITDSYGVKYYGFKFLNHTGHIEYVLAHAMHKESIGTSVQSFSRVDNADYSIGMSMMSVPLKGYRSYEMSSGSCPREWARWWANEFLHARFVAIRVGGAWIPCTIKPKSDTTQIVDTSKAEALHVDFTVTLAVDG